MRVKSNKVLVSAYKNDLSREVNKQNHDKAKELLEREDFVFMVVVGVYKGQRELSFLLVADDIDDHEDNLSAAMRIGQLFNQDTVLEVHNDDTAVLHTLNETGTNEVLGRFIETNKEYALTQDHTYEPVSDRYFVVES